MRPESMARLERPLRTHHDIMFCKFMTTVIILDSCMEEVQEHLDSMTKPLRGCRHGGKEEGGGGGGGCGPERMVMEKLACDDH